MRLKTYIEDIKHWHIVESL